MNIISKKYHGHIASISSILKLEIKLNLRNLSKNYSSNINFDFSNILVLNKITR